MRRYYCSTTTRGHGLAVLIWAVPFLGLCGFGCSLAWNDGDRGALLALVFVAALTMAAAFFLAVALRHICRPQKAFVEITDTELLWRDWNLFGMIEDSCPLAGIHSVERPSADSALPFLKMRSGMTLPLPATLVIPNQKDFNAALKRAAPHITVDERF